MMTPLSRAVLISAGAFLLAMPVTAYISSFFLSDPFIGGGMEGIVALLMCYTPGAALFFCLLEWRLSKSNADGETHCRVCNYILRGIVEARCPECGTPI